MFRTCEVGSDAIFYSSLNLAVVSKLEQISGRSQRLRQATLSISITIHLSAFFVCRALNNESSWHYTCRGFGGNTKRTSGTGKTKPQKRHDPHPICGSIFPPKKRRGLRRSCCSNSITRSLCVVQGSWCTGFQVKLFCPVTFVYLAWESKGLCAIKNNYSYFCGC